MTFELCIYIDIDIHVHDLEFLTTFVNAQWFGFEFDSHFELSCETLCSSLYIFTSIDLKSSKFFKKNLELKKKTNHIKYVKYYIVYPLSKQSNPPKIFIK